MTAARCRWAVPTIVSLAAGSQSAEPTLRTHCRKEPIHDGEIFFGFAGRHDKGWTDADNFTGKRAEQVDRPALLVAPITGCDASAGDLLRGHVADGAAFD